MSGLQWHRFLSDHKCECGACDEFTFFKQRTRNPDKPPLNGTPSQYIRGHHKAMEGKENLRRYLEEDHGHTTLCWIWQGPTNKDGYAYSGKRLVHRELFAESHGGIGEGLEVHHKCLMRKCVNPDHMEATTHCGNVRQSSHVRLNLTKVRAIRKSSEPAQVVADRYGVSRSTIYSVRYGQSWKTG